MILDGLEGDSSAGWDATDGKFSWQDVTTWPLSMQPNDKRSKPLLPNHHN
jgi:hypothetical protein